MKLQNKNILITGGARRVGAEIARNLTAAGSNVIIHYNRSVEEAENLQHELQKAGSNCQIFQADLRNIQTLEKMVFSILEKYNTIDGLVCNASVFSRTPFFSVKEEEWDQIIAVNLKSHFFLCQLIGKKMVEQNSGKIVIISDVGAENPWPNYLPYTISKAGLNHLVIGLAKVLAPAVQVNGVAPGTILPPETVSEKEVEFYKEKTLLKRIGSPLDIAKTVQFLFEQSDFITGAILPVDGGYRIKG